METDEIIELVRDKYITMTTEQKRFVDDVEAALDQMMGKTPKESPGTMFFIQGDAGIEKRYLLKFLKKREQKA